VPCLVTVIATPYVTMPKSKGRGAILNTLRISLAENLISILTAKKLLVRSRRKGST
jgi:hypothetical protein